MINWKNFCISIRHQCRLLGLNRSTAYKHRCGRAASVEDLRLMGLEAIYPRKKISQPGSNHRIYPYLLRDLTIEACNQVWCTDITYIPMKRGYIFLVAVMDWCSRCVLSWKLSNTLDTTFCIEALLEVLDHTGTKPQIFNTDQGCQFTSTRWIKQLVDRDIRVSMDGKGSWVDNVIIERFWRSLKHEEVYLKAYEDIPDAVNNIGQYIQRYNTWRVHSVFGDQTPMEVYSERKVA